MGRVSEGQVRGIRSPLDGLSYGQDKAHATPVVRQPFPERSSCPNCRSPSRHEFPFPRPTPDETSLAGGNGGGVRDAGNLFVDLRFHSSIVSSFAEMTTNDMRDFLNLTKALADENRVRLLLALRRGELCACQLTELLHLAPSTVSKHLFLLRHAGLVESRKDGRWIYFKLADKTAPVAVCEAIDWVKKALGRSERALADARQIKKILKEDPSELCKRICKN